MKNIDIHIFYLLPYGIQKRIELGRALAMQPKVILLDEPAAGMNNEETEDIARFILDIHEELGITVILIDHDMNMVMDIATEVVAMDFGEKLFQGNPRCSKRSKSNRCIFRSWLIMITMKEIFEEIQASGGMTPSRRLRDIAKDFQIKLHLEIKNLVYGMKFLTKSFGFKLIMLAVLLIISELENLIKLLSILKIDQNG